jgi:hypothetical protein
MSSGRESHIGSRLPRPDKPEPSESRLASRRIHIAPAARHVTGCRSVDVDRCERGVDVSDGVLELRDLVCRRVDAGVRLERNLPITASRRAGRLGVLVRFVQLYFAAFFVRSLDEIRGAFAERRVEAFADAGLDRERIECSNSERARVTAASGRSALMTARSVARAAARASAARTTCFAALIATAHPHVMATARGMLKCAARSRRCMMRPPENCPTLASTPGVPSRSQYRRRR